MIEKEILEIKPNRKLLSSVLIIFVNVTLAACGGSDKWIGTYGGTSSSGNKVEITIEKNGTVIYNKNGDKVNQLNNGGALTADVKYDELMRAHKRGEIEALELIIQELEQEFDLYNPDRDHPEA